MLRRVNEIPEQEKRSLEDILGRPLQDHQQVLIMVLTPGIVPDEATRRQALARIEETFARADHHAGEHNITPDEADAAVEEALEHVRYGKS